MLAVNSSLHANTSFHHFLFLPVIVQQLLSRQKQSYKADCRIRLFADHCSHWLAWEAKILRAGPGSTLDGDKAGTLVLVGALV